MKAREVLEKREEGVSEVRLESVHIVNIKSEGNRVLYKAHEWNQIELDQITRESTECSAHYVSRDHVSLLSQMDYFSV